MPDADVLWGLSQVFNVPLEDLAQLTLGRDLPSVRHDSGEDGGTRQPEGRPDAVVAEARPLRAPPGTHRALEDAIWPIAQELTRLSGHAAAREAARLAQSHTPIRRRRRR